MRVRAVRPEFRAESAPGNRRWHGGANALVRISEYALVSGPRGPVSPATPHGSMAQPCHRCVTHSRNQKVTGGHHRTRRRTKSGTGGHWRTRQDTGGHDLRRVRDREAPGSNPGPPTNPYARVERNALTLVVCGSSSSCLYRDDSTAISAILPATLL